MRPGRQTTTRDAGRRSSGRATRRVVLCWLVWVSAVWGIAALAGRHLPPEGARPHPRSAVEVLSAWDGRHYAHVAAHGYSPEGTDRLRYAFFPLFPALARLAGGRDHAPLAGLLLAQLFTLGAALLLHREEQETAGGEPPGLLFDPAFWLLAGPCSFFLGALYPESLFLFLSLAMAAALRRGAPGGAGAFGLLAGLSRPTALTLPVIAAPTLLGRLRTRGPGTGLLALAALAPLVGVGAYVLWVGLSLGDLFGYTWIQRIWGHRMTAPFLPLARDAASLVGLDGLLGGVSRLRPEEAALRLVSTFGVVALAAAGWRKLDAADRCYLVVSLLFLHSQEPASATPRHEMALFPIYRLLARTDLGRLRRPLAALLVVVQALLLTRHASWLWVS